jgi:hypothetical protein
MDMRVVNEDIENELIRVERETGVTQEQQLELLKTQMSFTHDMGRGIINLLGKFEDTERHRINADLVDKQSQRNFKHASRQLDVLEKVLTHHFAERKVVIEGGFRTIDKALKENNWDAAAKVFGDMSAMVAKSPLAEAIALNNKIKSGKAITLDDF